MSSAWHGGKGSTPRPKSVSSEDYDARWEAIFRKEVAEVEEGEGVEFRMFETVKGVVYGIDAAGVWHHVSDRAEIDSQMDQGEGS